MLGAPKKIRTDVPAGSPDKCRNSTKINPCGAFSYGRVRDRPNRDLAADVSNHDL
ncbi:hypothetical protein [Parasutterella sp.]|uniref:hypothetical protein n=1 Tax=Parasutterella sp. TaxID=2049037 RepID=UPI003AEFF491